MRTKRGKRKLGSGGFTMVELVVVIAILAIVAGAAVVGLLQYQRFVAFKRNTETAETLFMAAQAELTHLKANGTLAEFITETAAAAPVGDEIAGEYAGRLVAAQRQRNDDDLEQSLVYRLTGRQVSDRSLYAAAIRIEFDPQSALVYSVSYSDKADRFEESTADGRGGVMGVAPANRTRAVRRKIILGYYETSLPELASLEEPTGPNAALTAARLVNEETLRLELEFERAETNLIPASSYKVELFGSGNGAEQRLAGILFAGGLGTRTTAATTVYADETLTGDFEYETYIRDGRLSIVLDAMDIEAARILQAALVQGEPPPSPAAYQETYSIRRLGFAGEMRISARVTPVGQAAETTSLATNAEHPLTAELVGGKTPHHRLDRVRHLFNVRFLTAGEVKNYVVGADLDWGSEQGAAAIGAVFDRGLGVTGEAAYFPTLPELPAGGRLSADRSNDHAAVKKLKAFLIKPLVLQGREQQPLPVTGLGLVGRNLGHISALELEQPVIDAGEAEIDEVGAVAGHNTTTGRISRVSVTGAGRIASRGSRVGGLVGVNEGTLDSLYSPIIRLSRLAVTGHGYVGGIVGENLGTVKLYEIAKSTVTGHGDYVGGLAGYTRTAVTRDNDLNDITGLTVSGGSYVGGFFGYAVAELDNYGLKDSQVSGRGDYVGGIVGYAERRLTRDNVLQLTGLTISGGAYVGGVAGYAGSSIAQLHVAGTAADRPSRITGRGDHVGGLAGLAKGPVQTYSDAGIAFLEVSGGSYVGGLVGRTDSDIRCFGLARITVEGRGSQVGGIAGYLGGTLSADSNFTNRDFAVTGLGNVGGLVGRNAGTIQGFTLHASMVAGTNYGDASQVSRAVGGLIGENRGLLRAPNDGIQTAVGNRVTGTDNVGGLIGVNAAGAEVIDYTVQDNDISGSNNVGGAIGENSGALKSTAYAGAVAVVGTNTETMVVRGDNQVGGVIGHNTATGTAAKVYVQRAGIWGRESSVGGLLGYNAGRVTLTTAFAGGINDTLVQDCIISGETFVGGIAGCNVSTLTFRSTYGNGPKKGQVARTRVQGRTDYGGIFGDLGSEIREDDHFLATDTTTLIQQR